MMETPFIIDNDDKGLSIKFKTEANIKLASVENDKERATLKMRYQEVLYVIKAIEYNEPQSFEDIDFVLKTICTLTRKGLLSHLTLNDNEFESIEFEGYFVNKRYPSIRRNKTTGLICDTHAFNCYLRAAYDNDANEQIICQKAVIGNKRLYISKGGIITGEYVEECIIPPSIATKHEYTIQELFEIPVCKIIDKTNVIYVVDHRCPQLKELDKKYVLPVHIDDEVKNKHYNIRKYKKIK